MIGPDATINGHIRLTDGLIIYGKVYGDVITKGSVRIAKDGLVQGNVEGSNIRVGGTVIGDVYPTILLLDYVFPMLCCFTQKSYTAQPPF